MTASEKPVPVPDQMDGPYWEAARHRRLVLQRCSACGWFNHPPRIVCSTCRGEEFEWSEVSGRGRIFSYTVVHQTTTPGFLDEIPFVIVQVSIDEQPECVLTANLIGDVDSSKLDIDLPVIVDFEERSGVSIPQFRLA